MDTGGIVANHRLTNRQLMQTVIAYVSYSCDPIIRKWKKCVLEFSWEDQKYLGILPLLCGLNVKLFTFWPHVLDGDRKKEVDWIYPLSIFLTEE